MIYVYPCNEQTCAAFGNRYVPVTQAFLLYNLDTSRISYVDSYNHINNELTRFYKDTTKGNYRLPSYQPLFIYDPTQPEWQI